MFFRKLLVMQNGKRKESEANRHTVNKKQSCSPNFHLMNNCMYCEMLV